MVADGFDISDLCKREETDGEGSDGDAGAFCNLRPKTLSEYIGQTQVVDSLAFDAQDIDGLVHHRAARGERLAQGARRFTDAGPEHLAARTSQGFLTLDPRDALGRPIKRRDLPFSIHGENSIVDRVQDGIPEPSHLDALARAIPRGPDGTSGHPLPSRRLRAAGALLMMGLDSYIREVPATPLAEEMLSVFRQAAKRHEIDLERELLR